jgi:hypothetical protein
MRVFVDLDTQQITAGVGQSSPLDELRFKRSLSAKLEVQFFRGGLVVELDSNSTGIFGMKTTGHYDDDYVVADLAWEKSGAGVNTIYSFSFSFVNTALDALFEVDSNLTNDVATVTLMAELQYIIEGFRYKSQTLSVVIANDVNRGGESIPQLPRLAHGVYLPDVETITGGDAHALDGFPTASLATGYVVEILILTDGQWQWLPFALRDGPAGVGGVAPIDYDAMTNNRHWQGAVGPLSPPTAFEAVEIVAAEDLPARSFVTAAGRVADSTNVLHMNHVIGITMTDVPSGNVAIVVVEGEVSDSTWSWSADTKLFLNGTSLSTVPPSVGFSQLLAISRNDQAIFIRLQTPIRL